MNGTNKQLLALSVCMDIMCVIHKFIHSILLLLLLLLLLFIILLIEDSFQAFTLILMRRTRKR